MKINILRAVALALATSSLLSPARAQYPGASLLPYQDRQQNYFQDEQGGGLVQPPPPAPEMDRPPMVPPPVGPSPATAGACADCQPGYGFAGCGAVTSCCGPWYGYAGGLIMTRDHENDVFLSYETTDSTNRVLTTRSADDFWGGGFETRLGRYFNDGYNAVELAYWGIYPNVSEATVYDSDLAGDLNTILRFDDLEYDPGTGARSVDSMYFQADAHRLRRSWQAHNVEVNLLGTQSPYNSYRDGVWFNWLAGVRYFRFDDGFEYGTDQDGTTFDYAPEELYYSADVKNHLVGFQLGGRAYWAACKRGTLFTGTALGIYGNHMRHRTEMFGGNGHAIVANPTNPYMGDEICIDSSKNDVAFLGEWNVGMNYCVTRCWSAMFGYRAVALTGVALATNQIPVDYVSATHSVRNVDSNGSVILHGVFVGAAYNW